MTLTYREISERCERAAIELAPDLPKTGDLDEWQDFINELDDFDYYDAAHAEIENWDWTIYTHYGMSIVQLIPSDELNDAETQWHEFNSGVVDDSFGVYEFASQIAYHFLVAKLQEEISNTIEELRELAENQIENMENAG